MSGHGGGHGEKITRKMHAAVAALLDCPTVEKAAERVGVADSTLRRWLKRDDFRAALDAAARELVGEAIRRKAVVAQEATNVLLAALRGERPLRDGRLAVFALRYAVGVRISVEQATPKTYVVEAPPVEPDLEAWRAKYTPAAAQQIAPPAPAQPVTPGVTTTTLNGSGAPPLH